jgi:hypothetical protein
MSATKTLQFAGRTLEPARIRRYFVGGKESSKKELAAQPFIVAGAGRPGDDAAYGFETEEAFCRYAATTRHAERFARAVGTMKLGQQLEGTDLASPRSLRRMGAAAERARAELEELGRETGLAVGAPEFLADFAAEGPVPRVLVPLAVLFDRVLDSGTLTEPPVFGGSFFPVIATMPTLFGFNDKASGVYLTVTAFSMHDKTFFRGAAAFLFGTFSHYILSDIGFDNRAASAIAI